MKKRNLLLSILLTFVILFPMTAFAAEDIQENRKLFDSESISPDSDTVQEPVSVEDGFALIQGETISAIAKLAPDSVIREGLEVTYSSYNKTETNAWLEKSLTAQGSPQPAPAQEPQGGQRIQNTTIVRLSVGKRSFTIKWKKNKDQVDGYEIAYSISSRFPKETTKTVTAGKNASSKTISKLKAGRKYYVKIRAYKTVKVQGEQKNLYASWSKVRSAKVKK